MEQGGFLGKTTGGKKLKGRDKQNSFNQLQNQLEQVT